MKFENSQIFFFLNLMYLIILVIGNPNIFLQMSSLVIYIIRRGVNGPGHCNHGREHEEPVSCRNVQISTLNQ